jgi:hypothetical protein
MLREPMAMACPLCSISRRQSADQDFLVSCAEEQELQQPDLELKGVRCGDERDIAKALNPNSVSLCQITGDTG